MLKALTVENFKAFDSHTRIQLAPITSIAVKADVTRPLLMYLIVPVIVAP